MKVDFTMIPAKIDATSMIETMEVFDQEEEVIFTNKERSSSILIFSQDGLESDVTLADFKIHKVIGRGTFGKVFLIERITNPGEVYAMKSIDKKEIIEEDQIEATILEKEILLKCSH